MKQNAMWWKDRKDELMALCPDSSPLIVYNEETLNDLFFDLLSMDSMDRLLYAAGANPHPGILAKAFDMGLDFLIRNPEEEERTMTSCPGITPGRVFSVPQALSFPRLIVRNRPGETWEILENTGDIDDPEELDRIREARPEAELGFICGPQELSPVGALIMQASGQMGAKDGFVPLIKEWAGRITVNKGMSPMEIFNLSGPDPDPTAICYGRGKGREQTEIRCQIEASAWIEPGDILLIPGMGAFLNMDMDGKFFGDRGMECLLRARRMCQVKIR